MDKNIAEILEDTSSTGKTFTPGEPIERPAGDPVWPGRSAVDRYTEVDVATSTRTIVRASGASVNPVVSK